MKKLYTGTLERGRKRQIQGTWERKHFRNVCPSLPATIHAQAKTTVGKSSKKLYRMNAIIITLVVDVQNNTKNKGASELLISS